jgi:E3 ubiquitin-protein ligase RBBP6
MAVHFKFKSFKDYDTISFDGSFISVGELKRSIIAKKKLGKSNDFDLIITNAQTNEGRFEVSCVASILISV